MPSLGWWALPLLFTICVFGLAKAALVRDARANPTTPAPPIPTYAVATVIALLGWLVFVVVINARHITFTGWWWTIPLALTVIPPVWTTLNLRAKRARLDWGDAVLAFFSYLAGAALAILAWIVYVFLM